MRRLDENFRQIDYALSAVTGRAAHEADEDDVHPSVVQNWLRLGQVVVACDADDTSLTVADHCYTVMAVTQDAAGRWMITLRNPWGYDRDLAAADGMNDGLITMTWSDFIDRYDFDTLTKA
jgi:hypothetical protein